MDLQLRGKTAIVTGGGSNIGRAISMTLGNEGANVVVAELDEEQGNKVAREIASGGSRAVCIKTDVTNLESVEAMAKRAIDELGQLHILVNVVGGDTPKYFLDTDPSFWEKIISINYRAQLNTLKTVLPHMVEKNYGRIVNIGSDAGRIGEFREAVYSGCKGAQIALSKAIAREVGRNNVTVNVVCPGLTIPKSAEEFGSLSGHAHSTVDRNQVEQQVRNLYALRRLGTAQDIANAVAFLVSDVANFITGQTLSVSGGYSMM